MSSFREGEEKIGREGEGLEYSLAGMESGVGRKGSG